MLSSLMPKKTCTLYALIQPQQIQDKEIIISTKCSTGKKI